MQIKWSPFFQTLEYHPHINTLKNSEIETSLTKLIINKYKEVEWKKIINILDELLYDWHTNMYCDSNIKCSLNDLKQIESLKFNVDTLQLQKNINIDLVDILDWINIAIKKRKISIKIQDRWISL